MVSRKVKGYLLGGVLVLGLLTAGYTTKRIQAEEKQSNQILDNVYIEDLAVGGMQEQEAQQAVTQYVNQLQDTPFTLKVNGKSVLATAKELGVTWENTQITEEAAAIGKSGSLIARYKDKKDLEHEPKVLKLSFTADNAKVTEFLREHQSEVNQEPVDASLRRENGSFLIEDGEDGIEVNISDSAKTITDYVADQWDTKAAEIELTAEVAKPRGTREELAKVKDVLGTFSTDFSSSNAGRAANVRNGCSKINGTVLYPGDTFSVFETVSPFDAENGYELAGSYENGTVVATYGGGICQVSTTLYNAVIRAELEVKERYAHSMIVTYVQPSMDAAIAGTYKDFKFVNNLDTPIYIEGITDGGIITFNVYGAETRPANREVSFESELVSETQPGTQLEGSAEYAVGYVGVKQSAHIGKTARLWKVVKVNGVEESREQFNNSTYNASPRILVVGTRTDSAAAKAAIQSAIASQNENGIYTAAANAAAIAARPEPETEEAASTEVTEEKTEETSTQKSDDSDKKDQTKSDKTGKKTEKATEKKEEKTTEKKQEKKQEESKSKEKEKKASDSTAAASTEETSEQAEEE